MYAFEYLKPTSLAAAKSASGDDTRYLAGAQSLVQSMKLRLASAEKLIDLGAIDELKGIRLDGDHLVIGAGTTHAEVAASPVVQSNIPALAELAGHIGDPMVRNMGTMGGAIANADPAACYPAAVLGLGATICTDTREIAADDFFLDLYETELEPTELIVSIRFPIAQRAAYIKHKQAASRFALVGVMVSQGPAGTRVAVTGAKACAFRWTDAEAKLDAKFSAEALDSLSIDSDDLSSDIHGSASYRAAMIVTAARRAVVRAANNS